KPPAAAAPQVAAPSPIAEPRRQTSTAPELFVIALKHARAVDVATTINSLFQRATPNATSASRQPGFTDDLRNPAPVQDPVTGQPGRAATLTGELTVVPESKANSLIVRANRPDYELVRSVVQEIDIRPAQVLIEVLIIEARRDRSFSVGVSGS